MRPSWIAPIVLAGALARPAEVTLSQAVSDAWALSRALDSQKLEEEAAALAEKAALRRQRFSVHFAGAYRATTDTIQVTAGDFPFSLGPQVPPGTILLATPGDSIDLKLSLLQPLYTGGLLRSAAAAEAARGAAERELPRWRRIELAGRVKSSYFGFLALRGKRDSLLSLLARLEHHLKKVERLAAEELVRRSDLLEARAKADEARLGLQDLELQLQTEAVQFHSLCGHDPGEIVHGPGGDADAFDVAWSHFLARHPLLRSLDERQGVATAGRRAAAAAYLPQVGLFAEAHYGRPGQNFFRDAWTFYLQGGVNVSLPLFDWNGRRTGLRLADIVARKLENQRADFVRESERELRQLYLALEAAGRKRALLDGLAANAAEDSRLKERLYEEGQIDHTDLLAAMTGEEKVQAERQALAAQVERIKTGIDVLIGRCEEEE